MNKKIISIIFLLIILVSITFVYNSIDINSTDKDQYNSPVEPIDENNILEEIDNSFIEEDNEIEIGEMI
jgi:hypothetical protein